MFDGRWRRAVDRGTRPAGTALKRVGLSADALTGFGLVMSIATSVVIASGHLFLGAFLLIPTGLPDLLDGPVAKASGTTSVRGSFFDSVADRVSDALLLGGLTWYLVARHDGQAAVIPFAILAASSLVSYQRAKAELLGLPAKGGLMERAERMVALGVAMLAGSLWSPLLIPLLLVMLGLVLVTAVGRFSRAWHAAGAPPRPLAAAYAAGGALHAGQGDLRHRALARWRQGRVDSRWRAWRQARDNVTPGARTPTLAPRRAGEPLGRWRSRRQAALSSRSGRIWRARRSVRPRSRSGSRHPGASGR
ncbi:MAG: CDP-alcohol phosphatidyltransferase family protein [Acidimicrobiales bacterium]